MKIEITLNDNDFRSLELLQDALEQGNEVNTDQINGICCYYAHLINAKYQEKKEPLSPLTSETVSAKAGE